MKKINLHKCKIKNLKDKRFNRRDTDGKKLHGKVVDKHHKTSNKMSFQNANGKESESKIDDASGPMKKDRKSKAHHSKLGGKKTKSLKTCKRSKKKKKFKGEIAKETKHNRSDERKNSFKRKEKSRTSSSKNKAEDKNRKDRLEKTELSERRAFEPMRRSLQLTKKHRVIGKHKTKKYNSILNFEQMKDSKKHTVLKRIPNNP